MFSGGYRKGPMAENGLKELRQQKKIIFRVTSKTTIPTKKYLLKSQE